MIRALRALACAPLFLAVPVRAEDDPQARRDIVVTAHPDTPPPAPGGTDTVAAAAIDDATAVSLRDALAFSPGVHLQPRYGQEVRVSIRGSGIGRGNHVRGITLFQDGVPINLADGGGDFQEIDPQLFERIDVIRGASSLAWGAATLGGAINAATPTGFSTAGLRARLDGGSFGTVRGLLSGGIDSGAGDAFAAVAGDSSGGDRDHADRHALRFNGNVGLALSSVARNRLYLSAQTIRQKLPGALTRSQALADPKQASAAALAGDQARNIDSMRVQDRLDLDWGSVRLAVAGFLNLKALEHPIFEIIDQKSTDTGAVARLDWDAGPVSLAAGTLARFGTVHSRRFRNLASARGAVTFRAEQAAHTVDSYAEARWRPLAGVTVVGGADWGVGMRRQDVFFPAVATGRRTYAELSPRIGALFEVGGVTVYANRSRSHEMPGFTELGQVASFVPLDVQRGWTSEAGVRGAAGPARFDVAVYRSDLRGELLQFTVDQSIPAATSNAGRTRHQGVEASLDLALARWAALRQVYSYSDFRFRDDAQYRDNRLPVIPRHLWRGELKLGSATTWIAPRVEWVPQGAWADYRNTTRTSRYALLGVGGSAAIGPKLSAFLDLRNLTATRATGDVSAVVSATPASAIYYPVERRAAYLGLRARL